MDYNKLKKKMKIFGERRLFVVFGKTMTMKRLSIFIFGGLMVGATLIGAFW